MKGDVFGTFVLDNGNLVFADLVKWNKLDRVVQSVDTDKERITYIDTNAGSDDQKLDLKTKYDGYSIFLSDGTPLELKDLKENDVFYVAEVEENGDDGFARIYVWRDAVEGKFGNMTGGTAGKRIKATIGDKAYSLADNVTYTMDEGDEYEVANGKSTDGRDKLDDFYGEEVLALRSWKGEILFITGDAKATSKEQYGIIMKYGSGIRDEVKIYTANDEEVVYKLEESKDYDWLKEKFEDKTAILRYKLNKDGEIAEFKKIDKDYTDGTDTTNTDAKQIVFTVEDDEFVIKKGNDFGRTSVKISEKDADKDNYKTYYVKNNTAFFDMTKKDDKGNVDLNDLGIFEWDDIDDKDVTEDVYILYAEDKDGKKELDFLAILSGLDKIKDDVAGACFIDSYREDGTNYAKVAIYDKGVKTYELDGDIENYHLKGRVYPIETTSNNKIKVNTSDKAFTTVAGKVTDTERDKIQITRGIDAEGKDITEWFGVKEDAVIYDGTKEVDLSYINNDDFVVAVLNKDEVEALSLVRSASSSEDLAHGVVESKSGDFFTVKGVKYKLDLDEAINNNGYVSPTTYKPGINNGYNVEFIYNKDTMKVKALCIKDGKGDGSTTIADVNGTVTYVSSSDAKDLVIEVTDKDGNFREYSRADGEISFAIAQFLVAHATDLNGAGMTFGFDKNGNINAIETIKLNKDIENDFTITDIAGLNGLVLEGNKQELTGALTVEANKVTVKNLTVNGTVTVAEGVTEFTAEGTNFDNLTLNGGGTNSVHLNNAKVTGTLTVDAKVRVVLEGKTIAKNVVVNAKDATVEVEKDAVVTTFKANEPVEVKGTGTVNEITGTAAVEVDKDLTVKKGTYATAKPALKEVSKTAKETVTNKVYGYEVVFTMDTDIKLVDADKVTAKNATVESVEQNGNNLVVVVKEPESKEKEIVITIAAGTVNNKGTEVTNDAIVVTYKYNIDRWEKQ